MFEYLKRLDNLTQLWIEQVWKDYRQWVIVGLLETVTFVQEEIKWFTGSQSSRKWHL